MLAHVPDLDGVEGLSKQHLVYQANVVSDASFTISLQSVQLHITADVLISDVVMSCYATGAAQRICTHYRETPFVIFYSRLTLTAIEG